MASALAHELNQPLSAVINWTPQAARRTAGNPHQNETPHAKVLDYMEQCDRPPGRPGRPDHPPVALADHVDADHVLPVRNRKAGSAGLVENRTSRHPAQVDVTVLRSDGAGFGQIDPNSPV